MFERMEIVETIYEIFVEPYYKNIIKQMLTVLVTVGNQEEKPTCQQLTKGLGKRAGDCTQIYVDHPRDRSKPTCLIFVRAHSLDDCKILNDFFTKYAKGRPFKELRQ